MPTNASKLAKASAAATMSRLAYLNYRSAEGPSAAKRSGHDKQPRKRKTARALGAHTVYEAGCGPWGRPSPWGSLFV